jgi:hypothetical protein
MGTDALTQAELILHQLGDAFEQSVGPGLSHWLQLSAESSGLLKKFDEAQKKFSVERHSHEISNSNCDFQIYPWYIFLVPEATLITSILSNEMILLA